MLPGVLFSVLLTAFSSTTNEQIKIDGSSTVFPITEAVAEEFSKEHKDIYVTVGVSGTGGGFKKFLKHETDINDASREIKASEIALAKKANIKYLKIPVAYDGITVIVNPQNNWAHDITTAELKKIWQPGSKVKTWKQVRASWPDKPIRLFGPGVDSGTFDYFTEAINGKSHVSRTDFTKSEDDNVLVRAVSGDKYAMAFLGFAYFYENQKRLKALKVHNGKKFVSPNFKTINSGEYAPLSRQIYVYVNQKAAKKASVQKFIRYYIENVPVLSKEVGYIPLPKNDYAKALVEFIKFSK